MKHKFVDVHGIKFKLFLRFLSLLAIILLLVWLLQFFVYDKIYRNITSKDLAQIDEQVVGLYENGDLNTLKTYSNKNNCSIIVYTKLGDSIDIKFSTLRNYSEEAFNQKLKDMAQNLKRESATRYYLEDNGVETFNCGRVEKIDGNNVYFYTCGIVSVEDQTPRVMTFVLLIVSLVSLIVTLAVWFVLAKDISKPITKVSEKAATLSGGNLDVEFDSFDYTEVAQLSSTLNYSISEIKKSEEIQKDIIQNVSHELRTPLTMIRSYTELLQDFSGDDPQKRKEHLQVISEQTDRLENLVKDMIDLSKLQSKTMVFNKTEFDLSESLKGIEANYKTRYEKDGYKFKFKIAKNIKINADKQRIEQVVINLINNAINYSTDNKNIQVNFQKDGENAKLEIIDHGIGISQKDLPQIFDRHFRSTNSKQTTAGSGVGLTIVKEILDYHGYEINVQSQENKGTTFTILFS
ncbi:MAG: sensor histidine kinase [Christensenellales bacterium]